MTATETVRQIRDGKLRLEDVTEACLDRIRQLEPTVRAFAHHDADQVRSSLMGGPVGRLCGVGISVKDVLDTCDMPSEYGSPIWKGHKPKADAACVAWARAEGATCYGKTVTTELP